MADANAKFKIGEFTHQKETVSLYLLNPGEHFERFGGSSSGLLAIRTASLIVSTSSVSGRQDVEYDINGPKARQIFSWAFDLARKFKQVDLG